MSNKNIKYKSKQISDFYGLNRQKWDDFYLSERMVLKKITNNKKSIGHILDVGCACGGLGAALSEKFDISSYEGVDINKDAIDRAVRGQNFNMPVNFIVGDILEVETSRKEYDIVFSLSCADWNIETDKIFEACWRRVTRGGYFIVSLRITKENGINDIKRSYQYINFFGKESALEVANYVVFNFTECLEMIRELKPQPLSIGACGYWGAPSKSAVTPFSTLLFSVFYIRKSLDDSVKETTAEFNFPVNLFL